MELCDTSWNVGLLWYSLDQSYFPYPLYLYDSSSLFADGYHSFINKREQARISSGDSPFDNHFPPMGYWFPCFFFQQPDSHYCFLPHVWHLNLWFLDPGSFPDTDYIITVQKKDPNLPWTISPVSKRHIFSGTVGFCVLYFYNWSIKNKWKLIWSLHIYESFQVRTLKQLSST